MLSTRARYTFSLLYHRDPGPCRASWAPVCIFPSGNLKFAPRETGLCAQLCDWNWRYRLPSGESFDELMLYETYGGFIESGDVERGEGEDDA